MKPSLSGPLGVTLLLLCAAAAGGQAAQLESARPEQLVQELRNLPPFLPPSPRSDGSIDPVEQRRNAVYARLRGYTRPDRRQANAAADAPFEAPLLEAALREQLGLKLEPHEGTTEIVVIDHIERPTPD